MLIRVRQFMDPLFHYLNQPLGRSEKCAVWNPNRFWSLYKIELLEKCWLKDPATKSQKAY